MKKISGLAWFEKSSAPRFFKSVSVFALIFIAVAFSSGCKKQQPATSQAPVSSPATNADQAPVMPQAPQYTSAPVAIATSPEGGADLKQLNHAYVSWIVQNRRRPKSFEEFVVSSGIQVPPPPAGKKYVIDKNGFINFANN